MLPLTFSSLEPTALFLSQPVDIILQQTTSQYIYPNDQCLE